MQKIKKFYLFLINSCIIQCAFINNTLDSSLLEQYNLDNSINEIEEQNLSSNISKKKDKIPITSLNISINMIKYIALISQTLLNILVLKILFAKITITDIFYVTFTIFIIKFKFLYTYMYKFLFKNKLIKQKFYVILYNILFTLITPVVNIIIISMLKFHHERQNTLMIQKVSALTNMNNIEKSMYLKFNYNYTTTIFFSIIFMVILFIININTSDKILKNQYHSIFKPIKELTFDQFSNMENRYLLQPISFSPVCLTPILFNYRFLIVEKNKRIDIVVNHEQMDIIQNKYPFRIKIDIQETGEWQLHNVLQLIYDTFFLTGLFLILLYFMNKIKKLFSERDDLSINLKTYSFSALISMLDLKFNCYNPEINQFEIELLENHIYFLKENQLYNKLIQDYINIANNVIINICNNSWNNAIKNLSFLQTCILTGEQGTGKTQMQDFSRYLFTNLEIISRIIYEKDDEEKSIAKFIETHKYSHLTKIRLNQQNSGQNIPSPASFEFIYPKDLKNLSNYFDCLDYYIKKYDSKSCRIIFGDDLQGVFNSGDNGSFWMFMKNTIQGYLTNGNDFNYTIGLIKNKIQRIKIQSNERLLLYFNNIEQIIYLINQKPENYKNQIKAIYQNFGSQEAILKINHITAHHEKIQSYLDANSKNHDLNANSQNHEDEEIIHIFQEMQKSLNINSTRLIIGQFSTNDALEITFAPVGDRFLLQNTTSPNIIDSIKFIVENEKNLKGQIYIQKASIEKTMDQIKNKIQNEEKEWLKQMRSHVVKYMNHEENKYFYQRSSAQENEEEDQEVEISEDNNSFVFRDKATKKLASSDKIYLKLDQSTLDSNNSNIMKLLKHMDQTMDKSRLSPKGYISRQSFELLMILLKSQSIEEFVKNICLTIIALQPNIYHISIMVMELNHNLELDLNMADNFYEYIIKRFPIICNSFRNSAGAFDIPDMEKSCYDEAFLAKKYWYQENIKRIFSIFQDFRYVQEQEE